MFEYESVKEYNYLKDKLIAQRKVHYLKQEDFNNGTYLIKEDGLYYICEDIELDMCNKNNYSPTDKSKYGTKAFSLDFFAGISVSAKNVIIETYGHKRYQIKMGKVFSAAQRFFSIIELADTPFIPGQGPGDFGDSIQAGNNIYIKDLILGRSSHHCLRYNNAKNVHIHNCEFRDFEVCGIAMNGGENIELSDCKIGPNLRDTVVNSLFSAARFLPRFTAHFKNKITSQEQQKLDTLVGKLKDRTDKVLLDIQNKGHTDDKFFKNDTHMTDGNVYGLLIHPSGIAINDFIDEKWDKEKVAEIKIKNVVINDLVTQVEENIGISQLEGKGIQTDATGAIFEIKRVMDQNMKYVPDVLSEVQVYMAKLALKYGITVAKNNLTQDLIDWTEGKITAAKLKQLGYVFKGNGDIMFHVNKGAFGARFDGLEKVNIDNLCVNRIINYGFMGEDQKCGNYTSSHDHQNRIGYTGAQSVGINVSRCDQFLLDNINVSNIHADNGDAIGIRFINKSYGILDDVNIHYINSGYSYENGVWYGVNHEGEIVEYNGSLPNKVPDAVGIKYQDINCKVKLGDHNIHDLEAPGSEVNIWY